MGNFITRTRGLAPRSFAKRKLPESMKFDESALLQKLADLDKVQQHDLFREEELHQKDEPLNKLLTKIHGAIQTKSVNVTGNEAPLPEDASDTKAREIKEMHKGGVGDVSSAKKTTSLKIASGPSSPPDDEPGRIQAFALREILEAKNETEEIESKHLMEELNKKWSMNPAPGAGYTSADSSRGNQQEPRGENDIQRQGMPSLDELITMYRVDKQKLDLLLQYACLPLIGRFRAFGHQEYAFARAPRWWLTGEGSKLKPILKSEAAVLEAQEKRRKEDRPNLCASK